ncbi:Flp pilus assembly protein CpaB [Arvimicrobium flavum]|uniref:Flp pilus assembly protein CpaB n=1 Tax=Arvimicrobium flavum TaxID=3393320 RepID=UPI00237C327A|nr:Flp pilus assembly protein CpaB [Mesorhizobium shangrilense]
MPASRVIILGVAVAAAGGAGYVAKFMNNEAPRAIVQAPAPTIATSEVLVLASDVSMGTSLGDRISWQSWPDDAVNPNFITRSTEPEALEQMRESVARVPLYAGEPVRKSKLIGGGQSFLSAVLPAGHRAVATSISAESAAGGFILPNDFVDVIMVRRGEGATGSPGGFVTETILKNIRVLAIDQTIQEDEEGKKVKVGSTATLELTPEQAEIITVAQQMADRLSLTLRAIVDTNERPSDQADYLVAGRGKGGTVRLIRSGEVTEVGARK